MLVKVVDPFDPAVGHRARYGHIVKEREVPHHLTQTYPSSMRTNKGAELRRQGKVGHVLRNTGHPARIDLHDIDGLCLKELLNVTRLSTFSPVAKGSRVAFLTIVLNMLSVGAAYGLDAAALPGRARAVAAWRC
jgi:hypothetical protein